MDPKSPPWPPSCEHYSSWSVQVCLRPETHRIWHSFLFQLAIPLFPEEFSFLLHSFSNWKLLAKVSTALNQPITIAFIIINLIIFTFTLFCGVFNFILKSLYDFIFLMYFNVFPFYIMFLAPLALFDYFLFIHLFWFITLVIWAMESSRSFIFPLCALSISSLLIVLCFSLCKYAQLSFLSQPFLLW